MTRWRIDAPPWVMRIVECGPGYWFRVWNDGRASCGWVFVRNGEDRNVMFS